MTESHKRRRPPKYRPKYRVQNWPEYEKSLRDRGDITFWVSSAAVETWLSTANGKRGAQEVYSNLAIETALTLRLLFKLPLRQTEGFLKSILKLMDLDLPCPDHTTLSRRNQSLDISNRFVAPSSGPICFIVDSSGLKVCGQGEWHAKKHGKKQNRKWKKLHIAVNEQGMVLANKLTDGHHQDPDQVSDLLKQWHHEIGTFIADGIYDRADISQAVLAHSSKADIIIPPRRNAVNSGQNSQRDHHIAHIQEKGRFAWRRDSGYYQQSRVENTFGRYKRTIGTGLHAKRNDSQEVEIEIGCSILNRLRQIGHPDSYLVT